MILKKYRIMKETAFRDYVLNSSYEGHHMLHYDSIKSIQYPLLLL